MSISLWKQHPPHGHVSVLWMTCGFNLVPCSDGFLWVAKCLSEPRTRWCGMGQDQEQWVPSPGKGCWLGLCFWEKKGNSQYWSLCLWTFDYPSARKKSHVLLVHTGFFCSWYLWYTKHVEQDIESCDSTLPKDVVSSPILQSLLLRSLIPQIRNTATETWCLFSLICTVFLLFLCHWDSTPSVNAGWEAGRTMVLGRNTNDRTVHFLIYSCLEITDCFWMSLHVEF